MLLLQVGAAEIAHLMCRRRDSVNCTPHSEKVGNCQKSASALFRNVMTATAAVHKQIERYRSMTGEERLAIALDLHEVSCDIAREGIRHDHPEADPAEVERLLRRRLELTRAG
jgi:hypothetical protein